jgi:F-type H+-transporting ATPase subunit gamma
MAERLSEIEARIGSVQHLSTVISAMRAIAAARSSEARARLNSVRAYADTIGRTIAQSLALLHSWPEAPAAAATGKRILLIIGSQQGFVGNFNTRVLDVLDQLGAAVAEVTTQVIVVGDRALALAGERSLPVAWSMPMAAHINEATALANRLADALYDRIAAGGVSQVQIIHACPPDGFHTDSVAVRTLIPFDFSRFPQTARPQPPLIQLPVDQLLSRLADEYVFAELCEALVLSYAAENNARVQAMVTANQSVSRRLEELTSSAQRLRQEQITEEVVELAAGTLAQQ